MAYNSLEEKINGAKSAVDMLQNSPTGKYVFPVPPKFTNWMDEQEAWRKTAVIFDQSIHMTDLYVRGPDAIKLLSDLAVNNFAGFDRNKTKQLVCCNHDGYLIDDMIVFGLEDDEVNVVALILPLQRNSDGSLHRFRRSMVERPCKPIVNGFRPRALRVYPRSVGATLRKMLKIVNSPRGISIMGGWLNLITNLSDVRRWRKWLMMNIVPRSLWFGTRKMF